VNSSATTPNNPAGVKMLFRALRYRHYRLFVGGQGISLIGTWMQSVAMSWLVYRMTDSALALGIVAFTAQIPVCLLAPLAGVLADRWNRHRILVVTQILAMIQALALAFLVLSGLVAVWHIVALSLLLGLIGAFDIPSRQSFVVEMVERKEDLGNAIALNSFLFNAARIIGPSIGGLLIAAVGEGVCFLVNGVSYIAVIAALLAMEVRPKEVRTEPKHILHEMKEGVVYALSFMPIRNILLLIGAVSLLAMPYAVLMPVFAKDVLHGTSSTQGFLVAGVGAGALIGAIYLASRPSVVGLGKIIALATSMVGIGLISFSFSRTLWLSLVLMVWAGFGIMVMMASCNTILQTIVDDDKRGRVMSFYTMAFMGAAPIGSLIAGALAHEIGAPKTVLIGGACCILGAILFARKISAMRELVRPIYVSLNIIPGVKEG
jgi:MFS family permease